MENQHPNNIPPVTPSLTGKRRFVLSKKTVMLTVGTVLLAMLFILSFKVGLTYSVITIKNKLLGNTNQEIFRQEEEMLYRDPNRINILILGFRGAGDPHGGLLSDMMVLLSVDMEREKAALISIPRDLYVDIPGLGKKERINFAYAFGEEKEPHGGGLLLSKKVASRVTGVYIDYGVSVDLTAAEKVIEELGGIDVYVPQDFSEPTQWGYPFFVSQGLQHMDSETALYYARSRFASSDFDRARREQDVLLAIKNRALSLGVLANPIKIYNLLDILGNHIITDTDAADMRSLIKTASRLDVKDVKRKVLDTSPEGLLYSTSTNGSYILLPVAGNYDQIHDLVINIFEESANSH